MKLVRRIAGTTTNVTTDATDSESDWNSGTTYAVGAVVRRIKGGIWKRFSSKQNSNTNRDPATDTSATWWTDEGATNGWRMFDQAIQRQTTRTSSLTVTLDLGATERADVLALFNVSAASVQVTVTDAVEGVIYDRTTSMVSPSGITDWFAYFYEPIARRRDLVLDDLPPYAGALITVVFTDTGATVGCGEMVAGLGRSVGGTEWGAQLGLRDFSLKEDTAFGDTVVVERAYRRKATFTVTVVNGFVDELIDSLADLRATPALFVGNSAYGSMAVFGYYRDFAVDVAYPDRSRLSLELESLT